MRNEGNKEAKEEEKRPYSEDGNGAISFRPNR